MKKKILALVIIFTIFFSLLVLSACDIEKKLNNDSLFNPNHYSDQADKGAFFNYQTFTIPIEGRARIWVIIYENQITLALLRNVWYVFDFSRTGNYYMGTNGVETVLFSLNGDILSLRRVRLSSNHIDMQFVSDDQIDLIGEEPILLCPVSNIEHELTSLSWRVDGDKVQGLLGASVEVKHSSSQQFALFPLTHRIMADLFVLHIPDLALEYGVNILRLSHIGGPFLWNNEIRISVTSVPTYINLTKNHYGDIVIEME